MAIVIQLTGNIKWDNTIIIITYLSLRIYCVPGTILNTLHVYSHLIPIKTQMRNILLK